MDKWTILIILACIFSGTTFFRMYCRTSLKGHLLVSLGAMVVIIGVIAAFIGGIENERMFDTLWYILFLPGISLFVIGFILLFTIESGAARTAYSGHSPLDIMLGNVSSLEKKKYEPTLSRSVGMATGSLVIIYGVVKFWYEYSSEFYTGIFIVIIGLAIFVISIVALKGKKREL